MYMSCRNAIVDANICSCDSPVGTGKTTAVMAHLLTKADAKKFRRIFVVLPFTNIIEQSVAIYREALTLPGEDAKEVVAELHHRADFESEDERHLTALWRAPIIVTTAVAFFETLASATPATLRRLHELPGSAIFIDESHAALPVRLLPLAWKWINIFANEWGCYWVLASGSLCRFWQLEEISQGNKYMVPEIINNDLRSRLSAVEQARIKHRAELIPKTLDEVVDLIRAFPGPRLVILNTVQNASVLAKAFAEHFGRGCVEHLSTSLTPHDRAETLLRVRLRLNNKDDNDWCLIATSYVEAGVNLSFRNGFREFASLASLLQAAGRVCRGEEYTDAEMLSFILLRGSDFNENPSIRSSAQVLRTYFEHNVPITYELSTDAINIELKLQGVSKVYKTLLKYEHNLCFESVEKEFNVIENDSYLAIVNPAFAEQLKQGNTDWRELQKHSVQIRKNVLDKFNLKPFTDNIYLWKYGYDNFLGYMAGILNMNKVSNYLI
jgi:CRISPR/Cas system-associated endonuclease/helicase Cas3